MYKVTERVDTKEKLVDALNSVKEVSILNLGEFDDTNFNKEYCRTLKIIVTPHLTMLYGLKITVL